MENSGIRAKIFEIDDKDSFFKAICPESIGKESVSNLCTSAALWFTNEVKKESVNDIDKVLVSTDNTTIRQDFEDSTNKKISFSVKTLNTFLCYFFSKKSKRIPTHYQEHTINDVKIFFSHIKILKVSNHLYRKQYNEFILTITPFILDKFKGLDFTLDNNWNWGIMDNFTPDAKPKVPTKVDSEIKILNSRTSFFNQAINIISENPDTIRIMLNGPVCFHPDWFYSIRDEKESRRSFSKELKKLIKSTQEQKKDIRIIFFNSERYTEGLSKFLTKKNIKKFKIDIIEEINQVVENDENKSVKFCSINTGFFQVIFVTNKYCLETSGEKENEPVNSGILQTNLDYISHQLDKFDRIFDNTYKGVNNEIKTLEKFIKEINLNA